jgi:hypothetical protein
MINAPVSLSFDVNIDGIRADAELRRQPCFGFGDGQRLHHRPAFRTRRARGRRRGFEFELFQLNPKLFQARISDGIARFPLRRMAGKREFADIEKPALLPSSIKAELADIADLAYQKDRPVIFPARFGLPEADDIFLLFHALFSSHPRPRPAMSKERFKRFAGENRDGGVGQGPALWGIYRYL